MLWHRFDICSRLFQPFFELFKVGVFGIVNNPIYFPKPPPAFLYSKHSGLPFQGRSTNVVSRHYKRGVGSFLAAAPSGCKARKHLKNQWDQKQ
jgi:hypothetical protein